MNVEKARFLQGEFERVMTQYPASTAQSLAEPVYDALQTGDLHDVNDRIAAFMNSTEEMAQYDREVAYSFALGGRGDPSFSAGEVPESALKKERRGEFEQAVRTGQMEAAAAIIRIEQIHKIRAILRNLAEEINA